MESSVRELGAALHGETSHSIDEIARELDRTFAAMAVAQRHLPRETFDVRAVLERSQRNPDLIFRWVATETRLVPYRGALRGSVGVLLDRVGNSLDRAFLLYMLLKDAGQTVRLAHGTLSDRQVDRVLRTITTSGPRARVSGSVSQKDVFVGDGVAQLQSVDPDLLSSLHSRLEVDRRDLIDALHRQMETQAAFLAAKLGDARSQEPTPAEALRDHWWVQWQQGAAWTALDPTFPEGASADQLPPVDGVFQPSSLRDLPPDLLHSLQIRVVVEQARAGRLTEHRVLEHTLVPAELYGVPISFGNQPLGWPQDAQPFSKGDLERRTREALAEQREWLPVLRVGSTSVYQSSFTLDGDVNATPLAPVLGSSSQQLGRRLGGLLASGSPAQGASSRSASAVLTAEWIEYSLTAPGRSPRAVRRPIVDLLGASGRRGGRTAVEGSEAEVAAARLALAGHIEILPLAAQPSAAYVTHLVAATMVANAASLTGGVRAAGAGRIDDLARIAEGIQVQPFGLYSLAFLRHQWSPMREDVYLDRINIITFRKHFNQTASGKLGLLTGFDIVANEMAVRPGSSTSPLLARLRQGVLDSQIETLLAETDCASQVDRKCDSVRSAAQLLSRADRPELSWAIVRSASDDHWKRMQLPESVRGFVESDLDRGYAVVMPGQPSTDARNLDFSWWRIDPATGDTLGIGQFGWGQTASEKVAIFTAMLAMVWSAYCAGRTIQLAGADPGKDFMDYLKCGLDFVCLLLPIVIAVEAGAPYIAAQVAFACRVFKYELPARFPGT